MTNQGSNNLYNTSSFTKCLLSYAVFFFFSFLILSFILLKPLHPAMLESWTVRVVAWPGKFHRTRVSASLPTRRANKIKYKKCSRKIKGSGGKKCYQSYWGMGLVRDHLKMVPVCDSIFMTQQRWTVKNIDGGHVLCLRSTPTKKGPSDVNKWTRQRTWWLVHSMTTVMWHHNGMVIINTHCCQTVRFSDTVQFRVHVLMTKTRSFRKQSNIWQVAGKPDIWIDRAWTYLQRIHYAQKLYNSVACQTWHSFRFVHARPLQKL